MSGDEIFALLVSLVIGLIVWGRWLRVSHGIRRVRRDSSDAWVWFGVVAGGVLLWVVLLRWASWDVRESAVYVAFYMVIGLALVAIALGLLDRVGLSVRDDAIERPNSAARLAIAGAVVGSFAAFAGANIGDGPGWWVVVFCAGLSMGSLVIGWALLDRIAHVGEAIVVGRDGPAGLRVSTWFISFGILQGRAVAGDWEGGAAAIADYLQHSTAGALLLVTAAVIERILATRAGSPVLSFTSTLGPCGLYLCFTVLTLLKVHPW